MAVEMNKSLISGVKEDEYCAPIPKAMRSVSFLIVHVDVEDQGT